jgi:hypothetical protein
LTQFLVFVNLYSYFFLNLAKHFKNLSRVFNFGKVTHLSDCLRKQSFLLLIELLLVNLKVNKLVTSKFLVLKKLRQFNLTLPFYIRLDYFNSLRVLKPIKLHYKIEHFAVIRGEHNVSDSLNNRVVVDLVVQCNTSLVEKSEDRTTN